LDHALAGRQHEPVRGWKAARAFASIPPFMKFVTSPLSLLASATCGLAFVFTTLPVLAADSAAPTPAPGQTVPPHAAGGWPSSTTGDDKKPARTPEQQAQLDAVANELKRLANEFGPDSVVLQAKLLIRAMSAGALGATEVKVAGASSVAGPEHLEIDIETGLFFDGRSTTPESRRDQVWKDVAMPVLDEMVSFKIEPSALELVFLFDVQDPAPGLPVDPSLPSRHEAFRAQLSRALLEDLIADRAVGDAVREKVTMTAPAPVARAAVVAPAP